MAKLRNGRFGEYYGSVQGTSEPLTMAELTVNARYIRSFLRSKGWSDNAIFAILGNMQAESSINPGRWQSEDVGNTSMGYGLVQWTPATKYINWCEENELGDYSTMDNNLARIIYEVENGLQWIATDTYNMTFSEFSVSNQPLDKLTSAFMLCYERPADQSAEKQQYRYENALSLQSTLMDLPLNPETPETPGNTTNKKKKKFNFVLFNAKRRKEREWTKRNF